MAIALLQNGQFNKAIQLLRDQALLRQEEAEGVVARIASGQYGDAATLILQAQRGFGGDARDQHEGA